MAWLSSKHISDLTVETRAALLQLVLMNTPRIYCELDTISMLHDVRQSDCFRHCHYNTSEPILAYLKKHTFKTVDVEKLRNRPYTTCPQTAAKFVNYIYATDISLCYLSNFGSRASLQISSVELHH
jgi:hypothetical protein